ncbi:MAG TPA: ABC transporter substrate-binding protein [Burkholderiales bacterium]|nr:ABC transporter substrate-binding protein [Burkholderiales bacterium]
MKIRLGVVAAALAAAAVASAAVAQDVVKIGQIEAQTGTLATYGWMGHQGANMAVAEINKAGGFKVGSKTYKLELISPDTRANPQDALIQLKTMVEQQQVRYVFGPFLTNVFNGIEPYATQQNGKILMMGGATAIHAQLGKPNHDYLMRTWNWDAGSAGFGQLLVDYLKKQGAKKVAMLFQNDAFGKVAVDIYTPIFKNAGIDLQIELFEPGTKDFSAPLAKLAANKPDFLFPGYVDAVLFDIVRQATETGLYKRFFTVRGSMAPGLKNKDLIDDYIAYLPKWFEQAEKTEPKVKEFVAKYKAFYKTNEFPYDQAPLCSSSCYDHVYMLVEAMKKAGTVDDVAKVKAALMKERYSGLWNIRYDDTGEAVFDFDVLHMRKGGAITATRVTPK